MAKNEAREICHMGKTKIKIISEALSLDSGKP
jgi:hypothetical protein